jgi:hypothetical protein
MKPLIKKLVESYGPSGSEDQIREFVRAEIRGLPDYITVDPLGNLIAVVKKQAKSGKKVILSAHLDEIGFVVSHIDEHGFARVQPFGGVNPLGCGGGALCRMVGRWASSGWMPAATIRARSGLSEMYRRCHQPGRLPVRWATRPDCSPWPSGASGWWPRAWTTALAWRF